MFSEEIIQLIKEKRQALGISQREMAKIIFGDENKRNRISLIERGKLNIRLETLDKFINRLNLNINIDEN